MSTHDLQASLEAISASRRGDHPDPEQLLAYHLDELDPDAADAVEEHVALCSECAHHVLDMARFLAGEPLPDADPVEPEAVDRLIRSVAETLADEDEENTTEPTEGPWKSPPDDDRAPGSGSFYSSLGFARAAAIFFCLLSFGLAVRLMQPIETGDPTADATLANLPIVELRPRETRGAGERDTVQLSETDGGAVLVLPVAESDAFSHYQVTIEATGGELVLSRRDLHRTDGLLTLVLKRDALPAGVYQLRLAGLITGEPPQPLTTFQLDWRPG